MKIAIIGYGKMGKMIEKAALEKGHNISAIVDPLAPGTASASGAIIHKCIEESDSLGAADTAIEFTVPATAVQNISTLAYLKIPAVVGTTGWQGQLDEVKNIVNKAGSALLWSSNFSIGVNVFNRIAWYASQLMNSFPEYDIGGYETHHNKKLDSPSGTAKTLIEGVLSRIDRKGKVQWEKLDRAPAPDELHYPSLRIGSAPGTHSLIFDSAADTIELTHTARSREGFATGAICAAEWLFSRQKDDNIKKCSGVFTIDDMLKDMLGI